ncbi:MAG: glycosyltransferase family 2 protein [Bacteroidota bacterium]
METNNLSIGVVITCHNRKASTLECLHRLARQSAFLQKHDYQVYLTDDGCTDGTAEAVKQEFPQTLVFTGSGNLFWNGGMHLAYGEALKGDHDFYLWLNDDTRLHPHALNRLLQTYTSLKGEDKGENIICGATRDPASGQLSYSGFLRISPWILRMIPVIPGEIPKPCTTHTGNCVLIPAAVAREVGNIEAFYQHRWGDPDYGLRARKLGFGVYVAPGFIGECEANPESEKWREPGLNLSTRLKLFHSVKGYVAKDWFFYVRRHGGTLWPLLWLKPYWDMFRYSLGLGWSKSS